MARGKRTTRGQRKDGERVERLDGEVAGHLPHPERGVDDREVGLARR